MPRKKNDPPIDWARITIEAEAEKIAISIRLDREVIDYFKSEGKGYQTKINAVLRSFVESQSKK